MERTGPLILVLAMIVLFFTFSASNATSLQFSFSVMNRTVQMNQNLFFNVSVSSPASVNYTIYLNSTPVHSGTIPANSTGYAIIKYNVSNRLYGEYSSSAVFSGVSYPIKSDFDTYIAPHPSFSFFNPSNITPFFNGSAKLNITLLDTGNTPLEMTWSIPSISGIDFSLDYHQSFSIFPSEIYSIPINLSLSQNFQKSLNFSFYGRFKNSTIEGTYSTELFVPAVNLTFLNSTIRRLSDTTLLYAISLDNRDNSPLPITINFLLSINGSSFYYNRSYTLYPENKTIAVEVPYSKIVSVSVSFLNQYGKPVNEVVYSYKPAYSSVSGFFAVFGYLILTGAVIGIIVFMHYNFNKKGGRKRRIWKRL